mmetsp:Transcript_34240/g.75977  ORF Transcript_34240/g.75977 Transcript_34240/m.75977 type:complete len:234 (+) Transcript_34240:244-945(+)
MSRHSDQLKDPLLGKAGSFSEPFGRMSRASEASMSRPRTPRAPEEVPQSVILLENARTFLDEFQQGRCHWLQTTSALLALQLGWGLWLFPADYARLGWYTATGLLLLLALLLLLLALARQLQNGHTGSTVCSPLIQRAPAIKHVKVHEGPVRVLGQRGRHRLPVRHAPVRLGTARPHEGVAAPGGGLVGGEQQQVAGVMLHKVLETRAAQLDTAQSGQLCAAGGQVGGQQVDL